MPKKVFFCFHYHHDVWRANIVKHNWLTRDVNEAAGLIDAEVFGEVQQKGERAIEKWIREQLSGTSVTVVLIGSETRTRDYVKHALQQSFEKGNGMLGIYIHQIKDRRGNTSVKGSNYFGEVGKDDEGDPVYFSIEYPCYDWFEDDGNANMGKWIEAAGIKAGGMSNHRFKSLLMAIGIM